LRAAQRKLYNNSVSLQHQTIVLGYSLIFDSNIKYYVRFSSHYLQLTNSFLESNYTSISVTRRSLHRRSSAGSRGQRNLPGYTFKMDGGYSSGAGSDRHSSHESEDIMSMFFDFGSPAPGSTASFDSSMAGQSQTQEPVQRGGIRVSLACVPVSSL
jgi:hypothetical protein